MLARHQHVAATSWPVCPRSRAAGAHNCNKQKRTRDTQAAAVIDMCTLVAYQSNLETGIYELGQRMDQLVQTNLTEVTPSTAGIVLLAGLATSISPCTLSVLPLTIGYIGGYAEAYDAAGSSSNNSSSQSTTSNSVDEDINASEQMQGQQQQHTVVSAVPQLGSSRQQASTSRTSSNKLGVQAVCYSLGLASSLAALGAASSYLGRAYGQIGDGLPVAVALVAIVMGFNLLGVLQLQLPSVDVDVRAAKLPPPLTAYLAGATFALAASPCSTPVLASLLAYVSASQNPAAGGLLLLLYSCGYVAPLLLVATATGAAKQVLDLRKSSSWVTPTSGVLLVVGGTYALLSRLLPAL